MDLSTRISVIQAFLQLCHRLKLCHKLKPAIDVADVCQSIT
jgi:hypothetical protein